MTDLIEKLNKLEKLRKEEQLLLKRVGFSANTSLSVAFSMMGVLEDSKLSRNDKSTLRTLHEALLEVMSSVRELTQFLDLNEHSIQSQRKDFSLASLFARIENTSQSKCTDKDIRITTETKFDYVSGNEECLFQVLSNFIDAMIKSSRPGSKIKIEFSQRGFEIKINKVASERPTSDPSIILAKRMLDILGGHIIESNTQSILFFLPLEKIDSFSEKLPANLKILVADDQDVIHETIRRMFKDSGVVFHEVYNGRSAIDLTSKDNFDIILMDIEMPVLDGVEATKFIKQQCETPVVALTAHSLNTEKDRFASAGIDGYVEKPITKEKLTTEILRCLQLTSQAGVDSL